MAASGLTAFVVIEAPRSDPMPPLALVRRRAG
jgi:hypothetical protein